MTWSKDEHGDSDDAATIEAAWAQELEQRERRALAGQDAGEPWLVVRDRLRRVLDR